MGLVVVERRFPQSQDIEALQRQENAHSWCLQLHQVRFLVSYYSPDRTRMICIYEAPDAEAVRRVNDTAQLPYETIWAATSLAPPSAEGQGPS